MLAIGITFYGAAASDLAIPYRGGGRYLHMHIEEPEPKAHIFFGEVGAMASKGRFVTLIEENADELTKKWLEVVRTHPDMPTYRVYDEAQLYERAFSVYSQLGKWLSEKTTKEEIRDIYFALGKKRREEGFKLSELLLALIVTRRVLWLKLPTGDLLETATDLHDGMRISNNTILFFDRAMFFASQGYED